MMIPMPPGAHMHSDIKPDEDVQLFATYAWHEAGNPAGDGDGSAADWTAAVHGWVYEPEADSTKRRALVGMIRHAVGLSSDDIETQLFKERAWAFLVDNERDKQPVVRIGGLAAALPATEANGHFEGRVLLPLHIRDAADADGWVPCEIAMPASDTRRFTGRLQLISPHGLSVISDIDDTVKITEVHSTGAMLRNTFMREFKSVPGMAGVYQRLAERGATFHFVSASPWQLYAQLDAFLQAEGFPRGTFHLQLFRWKDGTFFEMVRGPQHSKLERIRHIMMQFPKRRFVLVGDSQQEDPEIYAALATALPQQVAQIIIRNVTDEQPDNARCGSTFDGLPVAQWQLFKEAAEINLDFE